MSTGRQVDRTGRNPSSAAAVFKKVLHAFEDRDLPYADVVFHLRRLLAASASPQELLEVLRRYEWIEPLPEYTLEEIQGILNEAVKRAPSPPSAPVSEAAATKRPVAAPTATHENAGPVQENIARDKAAEDYKALTSAYERARDAGSAAIARTSALASQLAAAQNALDSEQNKTRDMERALADSIAARDAVLREARESLAQRDAELAKVRAALESERGKPREPDRALAERIAARDVALREARESLAQRDAEFATLQRERHQLALALESRTTACVQFEGDLQAATARAAALTDELANAQAALESERSKPREPDKALSERIAARDAALREARESLAQRDAEFAALQRERHQLALALESRTTACVQFEGDLQAATARAAALTEELANVRTALESERSKPREPDKALSEGIAARDAALNDARESLAQRDAEFAALQRERHQLTLALESRTTACVQFEGDLQASKARAAMLTTELANARNALQSEQSKIEKMDQALAEATAAEDAARKNGEAALRKLDQYQAELRPLRASLATQQNEHRTIIGTWEARAKSLEAELQAERARSDARAAESAPARETPQNYDTTVAIDASPQAAPPAGEWRMEPTLWASEAAAGPPSDRQPQPAARAGKPRPTAGALARTAGVAAAIVVLAVVAWSLVRKGAPRATAPVAVSSAPGPAEPGSVVRDCPTCPAVTILPAGRFKQGSARTDSGSASSERPLHWVAIRPFALSTSAITVDEFRAFVSATGRDMRGCDTYDDKWRYRPERNWQNPGFAQNGSHPVTCVSWDDATAYAAWLSTTTGHRYRLPSASEWEYAARAGGDALQPWNSDASAACASANVADQRAARQYRGWAVFPCDDGYVYTAPVGSFKANSFGLNDMLGNVLQWTADCWHADYTGAPVDGSPRPYGDCTEREVRGSSWFTTPKFVRASYRNHFATTYRASSVGIRVARDIGT
ncbi:MAG: SUMF1/EgtB/PvdO family nonheme iron enzyme [Pseudomonadota bacterium]|nr:SUMF1/EgtB/PvdO family nonheme iron enzyme [Pseudomonadota bacterium]